MFTQFLTDHRAIAGAIAIASMTLITQASAANDPADAFHQSVDARIHPAGLGPEDAFEQAMRLLRRPDGSAPTRAEVDRAGELLMHAGPDAFERAMRLLKQPTRYLSDDEIAAAKQTLSQGGPDGFDKAMQLLHRSFGY